jgi:hypothetical protein
MTEQAYDWRVPIPRQRSTSPVTSLVLTSLGAALVVLGVVGTPVRLLKLGRIGLLQLGSVALGGGIFVVGLGALLGEMAAAH